MATVAVVAFVVLVGFYELFGYLGSGALQNSEVPLWLRSVQATASIFQATATGLAFIIGGLFAYYRFFKEETYSSRLQPSISTAVSHSDGHFCVVVTAAVENTGQTTVRLDKPVTQFIVSVRSLGDSGWTDYDSEPVLQEELVQPSETFSDQSWAEVPDNGEVALQVELVVGRAYNEDDEEEVGGWGANDIVNLLDVKGSITDASNGDAERG